MLRISPAGSDARKTAQVRIPLSPTSIVTRSFASLRISPAGSDARKTAQVRIPSPRPSARSFASLRISPAGSDARKTAQVQILSPRPLESSTYGKICRLNMRHFRCEGSNLCAHCEFLSMSRKHGHQHLSTQRLCNRLPHHASIRVLLSRCEGRHAQPDASSTAEPTGDLRAAPVKRHDALHDRQAQPCTARHLGA